MYKSPRPSAGTSPQPSARPNRRRTGALALATAVAALATGVAAPAGASSPGGKGDGEPVRASKPTGPLKDVTLITGDRVFIDAKGKPVRIEPGWGRHDVPMLVRTAGGRTHVVPADAERLLATGKLDRRLFDLTELTRPETVAAQRGGVKVIVQYDGAAPTARKEVRAADGSTVRKALRSLNAEAVQTPAKEAGELWSALTDPRGASSARGATGSRAAVNAPGVSRIWLDAGRKATLDKSVPQVGAPKAWAGGYDGKGVKIAVLDTGIDTTHPDLAGKVVAEQNFTTTADAKDRNGHGTHVASTAAGSGAKSGGAHKGVAPGAQLLNGKVLDDFGWGSDSEVLAGMEWAVAQGADVVNLSLGNDDTPGIDPLEAAVNALSASNGVLFAVSAGNSGPTAGSVGSPGSAEAALTVGAVDDADALAEFSSRGPRVGDGGVKPDVTAPGVAITAAAAPGSLLAERYGQNPDGYMSMEGTSMAAPHVAGAAAILKQRHPGWTHTELKGALTGSAKQGAYGVFEGGAGRIQVEAALKQGVFSEPGAVGFAKAQWPHADDPVQTKKVTYRNSGDKPVTLALTLDARDPKGQPAPAGFFSLGADKVTVPAGGTASVELTADTRPGGTVDGMYSAQVLAAGDGQSVRTPAVVEREVESYEVTFQHTGRDGQPATSYSTSVDGVEPGLWDKSAHLDETSPTNKVRLPKGTYYLGSFISDSAPARTSNLLVQPELKITGPQTVTLDARAAKPVDITVPDAAAKLDRVSATLSYQQGEYDRRGFFALESFSDLRLAHIGPPVTGRASHLWSGTWTNGATDYVVTTGSSGDRFPTGYVRHLTAGDLATVKVGLGASAPGKSGALFPMGTVPGVPSSPFSYGSPARPLPELRTLHLSTLDRARWEMGYQQVVSDPQGWITEASFAPQGPKEYRGGQTYREDFNTAVTSPLLGAPYGLFRKGNEVYGDVRLFSDGQGHPGRSLHKSARTTLLRNGVQVGENTDALDRAPFAVPADDAKYKLSTSVTRDPALSKTSTRIDATWEFRSKQTATETPLPASTARFAPDVALDGTAPAGQVQQVPLTVQGTAAGGNLKSLTAYASYDGGKSWQKLPVKQGKATVRTPDAGKSIALRAVLVDKQGNRSTVDVHDAYLGK
ncbi:S8 family serine peptidase [Streptomyces sp. NPDC017979]|uniref:S8 family serine peptidase n=1 Tax=Streptomyces sp. NPDC017979 TaxID=3365024 RepID=UPI00379B7AEE